MIGACSRHSSPEALNGRFCHWRTVARWLENCPFIRPTSQALIRPVLISCRSSTILGSTTVLAQVGLGLKSETVQGTEYRPVHLENAQMPTIFWLGDFVRLVIAPSSLARRSRAHKSLPAPAPLPAPHRRKPRSYVRGKPTARGMASRTQAPRDNGWATPNLPTATSSLQRKRSEGASPRRWCVNVDFGNPLRILWAVQVS